MSDNSGSVLLVGSVPLASAEAVFRTCSQELGEYLRCLPDGEVGDRTIWVVFQAYRVFHEHPDLVTLQRPQRGPQPWIPGDLTDVWRFAIKDGAEDIQFTDLKYASAAVESYQTFRRLRDAGTIPATVRFQVCLPTPLGGVCWFFQRPGELDCLIAPYQAAMIHEVDKILTQIPARDLAIQWDVCWEVLEVEGIFPWAPAGDPWQRYVNELHALSATIPEEVLVGYHFCYADLGHQHMQQPQDLGLSVQMANAAVAESGRRVDWVHMPVPRDRSDDAYFTPLQDLSVGDTRVFIGLIHHTDGLAGTRRRLATAQKYLNHFGVATECGFGRRESDTLPELLRIHRETAALLQH